MSSAGVRRVLVVSCPDWPDGQAGQASQAGQEQAPSARAFERVVTVVEAFCPQVEVLRPGTCAIGARGPARYFGGEQELAAKLAAAVREQGLACRVGVADGLFAAGLAASADPAGLVVPTGETRAFLAGQPVTTLGIPELADLLPRLGISTLGEFAALSAADAASRFGNQGMLAHRLATGLAPRPLVPRPPAVDLAAELSFDPPVEQAEPAVFAAKALASEMHDRLAARGLACVRVRVLVQCADGSEISRLWRHDGLLSALAVAERVRWQLDGWRGGRDQSGSPAEPDDGAGTGGITLLRLIPDQLVRAKGRQLGLWGDAVVSDRVGRVALRVQAMLGHDAVTRPALAGGRSPAEQAVGIPFGDTGAPQLPPDRPWPGSIPAPAPASVYPVPRAASVIDAAGEPVKVAGRGQVSAPPGRLSAAGQPPMAIVAWAGPWPVTERWWDSRRARRQARFQLVTDDGRGWLAVVQGGRWQIEASYD
jgi:protein ImuB